MTQPDIQALSDEQLEELRSKFSEYDTSESRLIVAREIKYRNNLRMSAQANRGYYRLKMKMRNH